MLGFRPRDPGPQVKNAPLGVRSSPMGPGPPGGDVQRAKRQRTITNSRPEQHLGITWDNKLRPPRRSEPGATRMKADLWPRPHCDAPMARREPRTRGWRPSSHGDGGGRTRGGNGSHRSSPVGIPNFNGPNLPKFNCRRGGLQGNHHSSRPAGRLQFGCGFLRRFAVLPDYDNALIYPNSRK